MSRRLKFNAARDGAAKHHAMPSMRQFRTEPLVSLHSAQLPKVYIPHRSPLRRFYYCKTARGKWHRVDRVIRGMRWNNYLYEGKATPMGKPLEHTRTAFVSGLLREAKCSPEGRLVLQEIKAYRHQLAAEHKQERRAERQLQREVAEIVHIASHPDFKPAIMVADTEPHGEHMVEDRYQSPIISHDNVAVQESKIELHARTEMPALHHREHAKQAEFRAEHAKEEHHGNRAEVCMATVPEHGELLQALTPKEEHHVHSKAEHVSVSHEHMHHRSHVHHKHRGHHHGHRHGSRRQHTHQHKAPEIHISRSRSQGPSEHETFYYFFQQPWTALLIGMAGKTSKVGAQISIDNHVSVSGNYAAHATLPRRKARQLKVTVADAFPPQ